MQTETNQQVTGQSYYTLLNALILWLKARKITLRLKAKVSLGESLSSNEEQFVLALIELEKLLYTKTEEFLNIDTSLPEIYGIEQAQNERRQYFEPLLLEFRQNHKEFSISQSTSTLENAALEYLSRFKQGTRETFVREEKKASFKFAKVMAAAERKQEDSFNWERSYRNYPIEKNETIGGLENLIKTLPDFHQLSELVNRFGELITYVEAAANFSFTDVEVFYLRDNLISVINTIPEERRTAFQTDLDRFMVFCLLLDRPFFRLTNKELIALSRETISIAGFLQLELNDEKCAEAFNHLTQVIGLLGSVLALLALATPKNIDSKIRKGVSRFFSAVSLQKNPDEKRNKLLDYRARLEYHMTRPSRLLLLLHPIHEKLTQLSEVSGYRVVDSNEFEIQQLAACIENVAQHNLIINGYQTAIENKTRIQRRIASLSGISGYVKRISESFGETYEVTLNAVADIFSKQIIGIQSFPAEVIAYQDTINKIEAVIENNILHELLNSIDVPENASAIIIYDIIRNYQRRVGQLNQMSATEMVIIENADEYADARHKQRLLLLLEDFSALATSEDIVKDREKQTLTEVPLLLLPPEPVSSSSSSDFSP